MAWSHQLFEIALHDGDLRTREALDEHLARRAGKATA